MLIALTVDFDDKPCTPAEGAIALAELVAVQGSVARCYAAGLAEDVRVGPLFSGHDIHRLCLALTTYSSQPMLNDVERAACADLRARLDPLLSRAAGMT